MAPTRRPPVDVKLLAEYFFRLPRQLQLIAVGLLAVAVVLYFCGVFNHHVQPDPTPSGEAQLGETGELTPVQTDVPGGQRDLFFCFWNLENLFDDHHDNRRSVDAPFDTAFAENAELRQLKYDHLATAILKMNDGKGPDVLACCEVESVRALELLQGTLNAKITDSKLKYVSYAMKNLDAGRHIAPGVLSRLPLSQQRTKLIGSRLRILETHLFVNNHDLCIVASHWTSKLSQPGGGHGEEGRDKYARGIYTTLKQMAEKNPDVDFLLCGDFNETSEAKEITDGLHATGDAGQVKAAAEPMLLDLMADKPADKFGTIFYGGHPLIYDHLCVSKGLLDAAGWSCDPASVHTYTDGLRRTGATRREPWRFGSPDGNVRTSERGYSDHFPVTLKLTVRPAATAKQ